MSSVSAAAADAVLDPPAPEVDAKVERLKAKGAKSQARATAIVEGLPDDLRRERILPTAAALRFVNISAAQWRRLRRLGLAPEPIQIGLRAQGYRLSSLLAWKGATQPAA